MISERVLQVKTPYTAIRYSAISAITRYPLSPAEIEVGVACLMHAKYCLCDPGLFAILVTKAQVPAGQTQILFNLEHVAISHALLSSAPAWPPS